jgi:hypothetical protein
MAAKSVSQRGTATPLSKRERRAAIVVWSVILALILGWVALLAHEALIDQAEQRCIYGPTEKGKPLGQIGAWRWWPPGYDCAKP